MGMHAPPGCTSLRYGVHIRVGDTPALARRFHNLWTCTLRWASLRLECLWFLPAQPSQSSPAQVYPSPAQAQPRPDPAQATWDQCGPGCNISTPIRLKRWRYPRPCRHFHNLWTCTLRWASVAHPKHDCIPGMSVVVLHADGRSGVGVNNPKERIPGMHP